MAKDINIHIKTPGAQQAKQELDSVSQSAEKLGQTTEQAGTKSDRASKWVMDGLKSLVGPLGFAAIATVLASAAAKVAKFFDDLKARCDEAVRSAQSIRKEYADLFEAMDAFDERSRRRVTLETTGLLKETAVSKEIGLPIINAYTRQFRELVKSGQITEEQYQQGLKETLGYGERHGGVATPELITLLRGWNIITPEQQGIFRRQISAGAAASGLTDAELIEALGRSVPTAKAMGWTPAQTISAVATIASGEVGRQRTGLPATTMQGLLAPQLSNVVKYGISEEIAQDPYQLLVQLHQMQGQMDQQKFTRMLTDIYGTTAAAGVSKLLTAPRGDIRKVLIQAATPEAVEAEQAEERSSRATQERRDARAKAAVMEADLDVTTKEQYEEDIREIGEAKRKLFKRREPVRQWLNDFFTIGEEKEKEYAAFQSWYENLSPEEKEKFVAMWRSRTGTPFDVWQFGFTPQQKYESLVEGGMPVSKKNHEALTQQGVRDIHYHHESVTIYTPRVGDDQRGPRTPAGLK
jgi:hypothetical protein